MLKLFIAAFVHVHCFRQESASFHRTQQRVITRAVSLSPLYYRISIEKKDILLQAMDPTTNSSNIGQRNITLSAAGSGLFPGFFSFSSLPGMNNMRSQLKRSVNKLSISCAVKWGERSSKSTIPTFFSFLFFFLLCIFFFFFSSLFLHFISLFL